jgi:hypothetical protein
MEGRERNFGCANFNPNDYKVSLLFKKELTETELIRLASSNTWIVLRVPLWPDASVAAL